MRCREQTVIAAPSFAENVPAWQVLGAGVTESRFEAFHSTALDAYSRPGCATVNLFGHSGVGAAGRARRKAHSGLASMCEHDANGLLQFLLPNCLIPTCFSPHPLKRLM
jgi:hypothetical protein